MNTSPLAVHTGDHSPLNSSKFLVSFFSKFALDPNHGFETGIEIRYSEVEQLRQFADKLLVQNIKNLLCVFAFSLCSR